MPDNKNYSGSDGMSIDDLLEETKMQIDAPPGEAGTMLDETIIYESEASAQHMDAPVEAPKAEEEFTPDFGDAFSDYGTYNDPNEPIDMITENPSDEEQFDAYSEDDFDLDELEDPLGPPKKPKRKTGKRIIPLFVKILLYVVIVGILSVGFGYGAWECAKDVLGFGRSDERVVVIIEEGDTIDDIAQKLKDHGIIKYPWLFKLYCDFTDSTEKIVPNAEGHELFYNYDYHALVEGMQEDIAQREIISLTIPEGYTAKQIFNLMEEKNVCTVEDLKKCSAEYEFDYWFLEGVPYGESNRLEGFLFPDTYEFYAGDKPERVLAKLLSNFDKKFGDGHKQRLEELNELLAQRWRTAGYGDSYIEEHRFTIHELMTVASMVEKESAAFDESANIASVIYNRLCNPANYPYLNIDATIVYAYGGDVELPLTNEHLKIDSPYNTYKVTGLPAGPISNPGLSSISAALYPAETEYYYYALDTETGYHHFSKTKDEHDAFVGGQNYG